MHVTRRDYLQIRTVFNLSGVVPWCEIKGKDLVELQWKIQLDNASWIFKLLLQNQNFTTKNICIQQASLSGDDRGLKKGENLYLLKMCTRPNSGSFTSNIFWASEKSLIVWNPRACPLQGPAISQHSVASPRWGSRVGITRFRGNKWETLLNNGDKDHLGHLSVALPWMCVHYRARNECSRSLYGEGSFWGLGWVSRSIRSLHLCPNF